MTITTYVANLPTERGRTQTQQVNRRPPPPIRDGSAAEPPGERREQDAIDIAAAFLAILHCAFQNASALALVSRIPHRFARLLVQLLEAHYRHVDNVRVVTPYEIRDTGNTARREICPILRAMITHYWTLPQQVILPVFGIQHTLSHEAVARDISRIELGNVSLLLLATTADHDGESAAQSVDPVLDHGDCALTSTHTASRVNRRREVQNPDSRMTSLEAAARLFHNESVRTNLLMTFGRYLESDGLRLARAVIKDRFGSNHWPEMAVSTLHHFAQGSTLKLNAYAEIVYSYLDGRNHDYRGFCRETIERLVLTHLAADAATYASPGGYASIKQKEDMRWDVFLWTKFEPRDCFHGSD